MIKGVIFDLDGVIVHTDNLHYLAWKSLADGLGIYFDEQINNRCRGVSRMDSLEIVLGEQSARYTMQQKLSFAEQKNDIYRRLLGELDASSVSEEVLVTIKELKTRGIAIAIGSSSKNTRLILQCIGLTEYFDAIVDGNDISHSKPHPEVFIKAAQKLGLSPQECIVVEDAFSGVDAALAGGFTAVAIGQATKHPGIFKAIDKLTDLLPLV